MEQAARGSRRTDVEVRRRAHPQHPVLRIITIVGCLLPSLLRLLGASPGLVVRLPSAATAVPLLIFNPMYPQSR
jgi:hypothetical protein